MPRFALVKASFKDFVKSQEKNRSACTPLGFVYGD